MSNNTFFDTPIYCLLVTKTQEPSYLTSVGKVKVIC